MQQEILHEIALSRIEGVGGVVYKLLINTFGSAEEVFKTSPQKILKVPNVGKSIVEGIKKSEAALKEAENIILDSEKKKISIVTFKNQLYPKRMKGLFDAPPILYFKGRGQIESPKTLAIVGTRDASDYGKQVTDQIVSQLKPYDVQIISGLAYGIDIAAHKAALKNELSTIAVLANSLETVYPSSHKKIATEIEENGLLISEQPIGTKLMPKFFVARNRIISALSDATLIVESGKKGGSMVTAEYSINYNREVFAVPGALNQKYSEGPNYLIANQKAQIYTNIEDFILWMKWNESGSHLKNKEIKEIDLSMFTLEESKILSLLMQNTEMLIDDLAWHSGVSLNKLASILLNLEFQDLIKQSPGKKFALKYSQ